MRFLTACQVRSYLGCGAQHWRVQRWIAAALASVSLAACSAPHSTGSALPDHRSPSFITVQPGNGGCTNIFGGCPIGMLCWDGSEPDPFYGSCPPAPPVGGPQVQPMPTCSIEATTLAATPLPRNRSTLGVGEQVSLSSVDGSTWTVNGDGTLSAATGGAITFTAGDIAGTATVGVSAQGCLTKTATYTIIAPSGLLFVPVNGIKHTKDFADIGMQANVYLQPDSVSFKGIAYLEADALATATGVYACLNNQGHNPNPNPLIGQNDDIVGLGTPISTDTIESGSCSGDQLVDGSVSVNIPQIYMVGLGGVRHTISVVQHIASASGGALNIRKGAASRSTNVSSPTSGY